MNWIGSFKPGVQLVDIVIAVIVIEMGVFALLRRWPIVLGLVPGLLLILAVLAAWAGAGLTVAIAWLTLALPAHLLDLRQRLRAPQA